MTSASDVPAPLPAMRLRNRVALVTGSGQGIGQAIGNAFARNGATVVFSDVVAERAQAAADAMAAEGLAADALPLDVGEPASIADGFARLEARHGRLDILVNNAGIGISAPFLEFPLEDFERVLRINLTGAFLCAQHAGRQMLAQEKPPEDGGSRRGKIVNITSVSGQRGGMGRAGYGASKAGLDLLTRVMATELAGQGINVNAIAPGPVGTELSRAVHMAGGTRDAYLFLASRDADYVNGHTLNVDGGFGAARLMYPLPGREGRG